MQSFVRSLIETREGASGALANVIDEVVAGVSGPAGARWLEQPGYADGLVRRALLREAIAALSGAGHVPLVMGDALWGSSLGPSPLDRACRALCLVVAPERRRPSIEALSARGFVLHRDVEADWFSLEGLPALLCLRDSLHDPVSPFALRMESLRSRAQLDSQTFGAAAWLPGPEDGLCAWAVEAADAVLHGRSPNWHDAAQWQSHYPSEAERLGELACEHGLLRLLPTLLVAAHDVSGDASLGALAGALGRTPLTDLAARVCLRSFDGSVADRRLGALVLYALSPSPAAVRRALAERALKVATRAVSKM